MTWHVVRNKVRDLAQEKALSVGELFIVETRQLAMIKVCVERQERDRVAALVLEWLQLEKGRPPFRVLGTEQERDLRFGPLSLRGMIDRIDGLESGLRVVMDYKTGRVSPTAWLGERPDEPQLPAYLIAAQPSAAADHGAGAGATDAAAQRSSVAIRADGVAFARVAGGRCEFVGLAVADDLIAGVKTPPAAFARSGDTRAWRQHRQLWATALQALADQFVQGAAAVAPKAGPTTCRWCDLHGLCRIGG